MPLISVIIPVYNVEKYLSRCVDSILHQSFSDFELILVDDGSPDRCGEICENYAAKDHRIHVIHQENGGLSAARNAGIDYAFQSSESEWITFIDSDDWIHPDYLKILYNEAKRTNCDIAVCELIRTDGETPENRCRQTSAIIVSPEELWCNTRDTATVAWCKIYKKVIFSKLRYPDRRLHEDEFVTYQALFQFERIAYISAQMYYYYQNPEGIMHKNRGLQSKTDSADVFYEQCAYFHKNGFNNANRISAKALFITCAEVIKHLVSRCPEEKKSIRKYRSMFRKTYCRYGNYLSFGMVGGRKKYLRLAHPLLMKLLRTSKHTLISIGRLFHA